MSNQTENITHLLFSDLEKSNTKISKKVANWLDQDWLREVIAYHGVFWYVYSPNVTMPRYVHNCILKWGRSKGFTYIGDVKDSETVKCQT